MKKRLLMTFMISATCLAACSSKGATLSTTDGHIYNNDKVVKVIEHGGSTALSALPGNGAEITYCFHTEFETCPNNTVGVAESDVTLVGKKNKDISYFSMYLGSQFVIHKSVEGGFVCGYVRDDSGLDSGLALSHMMSEIEDLDLYSQYTSANMDDQVVLTNFDEVIVRPNELTIPGILKVVKDTVKTDKTTQVGEMTVGFTSTEKYDFYQWNEFVVKVLKGYDISQCVTFNPKRN